MAETFSVWFSWHILEYSLDPVVCYIPQPHGNKDYGTPRLHMAKETKDTESVTGTLNHGLWPLSVPQTAPKYTLLDALDFLAGQESTM